MDNNLASNMINKDYKINIVDYSDMDHQIIAHTKIFFGDKLNFCLLFRLSEKKETIWTYKYEISTISSRDESKLRLQVEINSILRKQKHTNKYPIKKFSFLEELEAKKNSLIKKKKFFEMFSTVRSHKRKADKENKSGVFNKLCQQVVLLAYIFRSSFSLPSNMIANCEIVWGQFLTGPVHFLLIR